MRDSQEKWVEDFPLDTNPQERELTIVTLSNST